MHKNNYSLEVLVNGRPIQEFFKDNKAFVEARPSTEYTLRFRNNSWKRVMAIFSVDGIEVLKGKAASEADNGYIVDAFSSIEVKGYRIDDKNVAAFKFSDLAKGYNITVGAATVDKSTGETTYDKTSKNSGVIGVRVVEEAAPDFDYKKQYSSGGSSSRGSSWGNIAISGGNVSVGSVAVTGCISTSMYQTIAGVSGCLSSSNQYNALSAYVGPAAAPSFDTSTAWGSKLEDKVKEVSFKRSTTVTDLEIYYASRVSLEQFGIDFSNTKQIFAWPSAFEDKKQYCKVPANWEGNRK